MFTFYTYTTIINLLVGEYLIKFVNILRRSLETSNYKIIMGGINMRYFLEIREVGVEKVNADYGKHSDNKQELLDIVEQYKDDNGKPYYVEISDTTPNEEVHVIVNEISNHSNKDIPIINLNESIETLH